MTIKGYVTLSSISEQRKINYHTLRRWLGKTKVKTERAGTMILIKQTDVPKILAVGGVKC